MCHLKKPVCTSLKIDRTCFATYLAGLVTAYFISLGILDPITASVIWVQFMSVGYLPNPKSFFGSSLCLKKGVCAYWVQFFWPITNSCFSNMCAFAFLQWFPILRADISFELLHLTGCERILHIFLKKMHWRENLIPLFSLIKAWSKFA